MEGGRVVVLVVTVANNVERRSAGATAHGLDRVRVFEPPRHDRTVLSPFRFSASPRGCSVIHACMGARTDAVISRLTGFAGLNAATHVQRLDDYWPVSARFDTRSSDRRKARSSSGCGIFVIMDGWRWRTPPSILLDERKEQSIHTGLHVRPVKSTLPPTTSIDIRPSW